MDNRLVVEIRVPLANKKRANVGTGSLVGQNMILTACHVLYPRNYDPNGKICVRCHPDMDVNSDENGWVYLERDKIRWRGSGSDNENQDDINGKVDAALLAFEFPEEFHDAVLFTIDCPEPFDNWNGYGYPRAGVDDKMRRQLTGMIGEVIGVFPGSPILELGIKYHPESVELWKGGSGSPVFVNDKIVAVLSATPENYEGKKLFATRISTLLQDENFCTAIGSDERKMRLKLLQEVVEEELCHLDQNTSQGCKEICKVFNLLEVESEPLSEVLYGLSFNEVADGFRGVILELSKQKSSEAQTIFRLLCSVLPLKCDIDLVEKVRCKKLSEEKGKIKEDIATETMAELVLAKIKNRSAQYRVGKAQYPAGLLDLGNSAPPTFGMDPEGKECEEGFHKYLQSKYAPESKFVHADPFGCFLMDAWKISDKKGEKIAPEMKQHLANKLQRFSNDTRNPRAAYMTFRQGTFPDNVINELKKVYKSMVFLELSNDVLLRDQEEGQLYELLDILHSRLGEKNDSK